MGDKLISVYDILRYIEVLFVQVVRPVNEKGVTCCKQSSRDPLSKDRPKAEHLHGRGSKTQLYWSNMIGFQRISPIRRLINTRILSE